MQIDGCDATVVNLHNQNTHCIGRPPMPRKQQAWIVFQASRAESAILTLCCQRTEHFNTEVLTLIPRLNLVCAITSVTKFIPTAG